MYQSEDCGLFIGMLTTPLGKGWAFYQNEIKTLFDAYKKGMEQSYRDLHHPETPEEEECGRQFRESFYRPAAYGLFGSFDLAVIALVDDFSIGTRSFHPYNYLIGDGKAPEYQPYNYTFHVMSGVAPRLTLPDGTGEAGLYDKARRTFLSSRFPDTPDEYPLIGISCLKLNNALLIGSGGPLVNLVVHALERILGGRRDGGEHIEFILSHSFSWHELTLLLFSDSYREIGQALLAVRELTFGDLRQAIGPEWEKRYEEVARTCLLRDSLGEDEGKARRALASAHLFVHTHTSFGFDFRILHDGFQPDRPPVVDGLDFYLRWFVKPGHLASFQQAFRQQGQLSDERVVVGRGDFAHRVQAGVLELRQIVDWVVKHDLTRHIRGVHTIPHLEFDAVDGRLVDEQAHVNFHERLPDFAFSLEDITQIRHNLRACRVSKALQEKVTNMFVIYNDGIRDPILYGYFIDLRFFLERVQADIEVYATDQNRFLSVKELTGILAEITYRFETAYKNRFGQSYVLNEITDYNIEFNGGIHQLISAYDMAYKSLTALLGEKDPAFSSFTFVSGYSASDSDITSMRLNYFHLFQPEMFVATAANEAASFYLDRLHQNQSRLRDVQRVLYTAYADLISQSRGNLQPGIPLDTLAFFLRDYFSYYLSFNQNFELYAYWYWNYFMQMSVVYHKDGTIVDGLFLSFLLRFAVLAGFSGHADRLMQLRAPAIQLQDLWELHLPAARKGAEQIVEDNADWLHACRKTAERLAFEDLAGFSEQTALDRTEINQRLNHLRNYIARDPSLEELAWQQKDKEDFLSNLDPLDLRWAAMERDSATIAEMLEKGRPILPGHWSDPVNHYGSRSFFYQTLFLAYLKAVRRIAGNGNPVLFRKAPHAAPHVSARQAPGKPAPREGRLLFDPLGGLFSGEATAARELMRCKSAFLMALWHLSTVNKKLLFRKVENEERE